MILDNVGGFKYLITYILLCYLIGIAFTRSKQSQALKFIRGFMFLTCALYPMGFIVQLNGLSWDVYYHYFKLILVIMVIASIAFIAVRIYFKDPVFSPWCIVRHVRDYWFVYVIVIMLTTVSVMNIQENWIGNMHDDGYYMIKIATYPFAKFSSYLNPASGLQEDIYFSARTINTYEIEASCWMYMFNIPSTIFIRYFLVLKNYYIFAMSILCFAHALNPNPEKKEDEKEHKMVNVKEDEGILTKVGNYLRSREMKPWYFQFLVLIIFLFVFWQWWSPLGNQILNFVDQFKFNTAMWYGSTLVMGIPFFAGFASFIKDDYPWWEIFPVWFLFCVAMVSQASQALGILVIMSFAMAVLYFVQRKKSWTFILAAIVVVVYIFICMKVPETKKFTKVLTAMTEHQTDLVQTLCFRLSIAGLIIATVLGNKQIRIWNIVLLVMAACIFISPLNKPFVWAAQGYSFVVNRNVDAFQVTLIISAFIEIFFVFYKLIHFGAVSSAYALLLGSLIWTTGYNKYLSYYDTTADSWKQIVSENPYLIPQGLYNISTKLNEIQQASGDDNFLVVAPIHNVFDSYPTYTSYTLRAYAPNIQVLNSLYYYEDAAKDSIYKTFDMNDFNIFNAFCEAPQGFYNLFKEVVQYYDVDAFVIFNNGDIYEDYVSAIGFHLAATVDCPQYGSKEGVIDEKPVYAYIFVKD